MYTILFSMLLTNPTFHISHAIDLAQVHVIPVTPWARYIVDDDLKVCFFEIKDDKQPGCRNDHSTVAQLNDKQCELLRAKVVKYVLNSKKAEKE